MRKKLSTVWIIVLTLLATLQWQQLVYRWGLYIDQHGGKAFENHVGDGVFAWIHGINATLVLVSVLALHNGWSQSRMRGIVPKLLFAALLANVLAWVSFGYMHQQGILVEYQEFIQHLRRQ